MALPLMKQADGQGPDALRRRLAWSGTPPAAARARAEADALLSALQQTHRVTVAPHTADDVRLAVSELVTNAARHAPGPGCMELQTAGGGRIVRITVWDASPALPQTRPAAPNRAGGHGLAIVQALSSHLLIQRSGEGKQITAEIPLPEGGLPASHGRYGRSAAPGGSLAPDRATEKTAARSRPEPPRRSPA
ncbi:ATP-binding protein [Streptomyces violaceus]